MYLLLPVLILSLCGCDSWGRKTGYYLVPYVAKDASLSINSDQVDHIQAKLDSALAEVAQRHNLQRYTEVVPLCSLCYLVPDVEGEELTRGDIGVVREELDGSTKLSLGLYEFSTVWPYGERIFDEVVSLLAFRDGLVLTIERQPPTRRPRRVTSPRSRRAAARRASRREFCRPRPAAEGQLVWRHARQVPGISSEARERRI